MNYRFRLFLCSIIIFLMILTSCSLNRLIHSNYKAGSTNEIRRNLAKMLPGDTLLIESGVYDISLWDEIPSGNNWEKPIVIKAIASREVFFKPSSGLRVVNFGRGYQSTSPAEYIELHGLVLDASGVEHDAVKISKGANHIRIVNCEILNSKNQGILIVSEESDYNEIISSEIHNNGTDIYQHGIYISTDNNIIDSCIIYNNTCCGINLYNGKGSVNYNKVSNCLVYNNATSKKRGTGITSYVGKGNMVSDNIVFGNNWGIRVDYGAEDIEVTNNIIFGNLNWQLLIGKGAKNVDLRNNIVSSEENATSIRIDGIHNAEISRNGQDDYTKEQILKILENNSYYDHILLTTQRE